MKEKPLSKDQIFDALAELEDAEQRLRLLEELCDGDDQLRGELEDLLRRDQQIGSFLQSPPIEFQPAVPGEATSESASSAWTGAMIGPYQLLQEIGHGGMGSVYLAQQTKPVKRKVALKLIKSGLDSRQVIARFDAERQALALMEHPFIAKFIDAGTTPPTSPPYQGEVRGGEPHQEGVRSGGPHQGGTKDQLPPFYKGGTEGGSAAEATLHNRGLPYFVMEHVPGAPITKFCDQHSLPIEVRLNLFRNVCQAIQHAHQKGIIHRDLKPSNILVMMIDDQPVPRVIDFGLAKATESRLTDDTLHTRFGQVMGTFEYMSPEQTGANGADVDTRSDIYSLGAILYELLVGTPPFDVESFSSQPLEEVLRMIRQEDPPTPCQRLQKTGEFASEMAAHRAIDPDKIRRVIKGDLEWIVMKALDKDPARRYGSAMELADDLQRFLEHRPVEAGSPPLGYRAKKFVRRNLRRHPMRSGLIAATLLLLVIGFAAAYMMQQLSIRAREIRATEMLRDGEAYLARLAEARELLSKRDTPWREETLGLLEEAADLDLPNRDDVQLRTLVATTAIQRDLEPIATIAEGIWCDVLAFDPRGKFLAVGQNKDETGFFVWIFRADDWEAEPYHLWIDDTEQTAQRKAKDQPRPEDGARAICFSPDGTQLAVGTRHGRLHLFQWDGRQATHLATYDPDPGIEVYRIYFSPDGQSLWVLSDDDRLRVIRDHRMEPFPPIGDATIKDIAVAPNGDAVVMIRDHRLVERYEFDGSEGTWQVDYDRENNDCRNVTFSRDGRFLFVPLGSGSKADILNSDSGHVRSRINLDTQFSGVDAVFGWDDSVVATTSYERIVALWDVAHREKIASHLVSQRGGRPRIAASPTEPMLAVAEHMKVTIFRFGGTEHLGTVAHASSSIRDVATDMSSATIATVGTNNDGVNHRRALSYGVWNADSWHPLMNYKKHDISTLAYPDEPRISFAPDGKHLVSVEAKGGASLVPIHDISAEQLPRWTADLSHWLEPTKIEIVEGSLAPEAEVVTSGSGYAVPIVPTPKGIVSLTIDNSAAKELNTMDVVHAYFVCRIPDEPAVQNVSVKADSTSTVVRSAPVNLPPDGRVAIWVGAHQLRNQQMDYELTLELAFDPPVKQILLEGVLLTKDKLRGDSQSTDSPRQLGPLVVHPPTNTLWGVFDTEEIRIFDYGQLRTLGTWTNQSVSYDAGLGTLQPLLAAGQWVVSGTIGGEIFVFDAASRRLENSALLAEAEVRGLCELPESQQLVAAFNDGSFQVLDLPGLEAQQTIKHHRYSIETVCYDPHRQWLFAGSEGGSISVWRRVGSQFQHHFSIDLMLGSVSRMIYLERGDRLVALIAGETALREIRLRPLCQRLCDMGLVE